MSFTCCIMLQSEAMEQSDRQKSVRVTASIPSDLFDRLVKFAEKQKVSQAWVVREALDQYLNKDLPLFNQDRTTK